MLQTIEKIVLGMAAIRIFSGMFEITAALVMLHYNTVERALLVNSLLSMVGPIIFFSTMTLGLYGISTKMNASNLFWIMAGIALILYGIKK